MVKPIKEHDFFIGKSFCEIDIIRNEIYARQGIVFENENIQKYFETKPWYEQKYGLAYMYRHSDEVLDPVSRLNAEKIKEYQENTFSHLLNNGQRKDFCYST